MKGKVISWNKGSGFGFVRGPRGISVYVHHSLIGGELVIGEDVEFEHEVVQIDGQEKNRATKCSGYGVRKRGKEKGIVVSWMGNFGFIGINKKDVTECLFVHKRVLGDELQLSPGQTVYFDIVDKNGREEATSLSGPGVVRESEAVRNFFKEIRVDIDQELLDEFRIVEDLMVHPRELSDKGFSREAVARIMDKCGELRELKAQYKHSKKNSRPENCARVSRWDFIRGYGFVFFEDKKKRLMVPMTALGSEGGHLIEGEEVIVVSQDKGRATEVTGFGVKPRGKVRGLVKSWNVGGGYGWVTADDTCVESHFAQRDLPMGCGVFPGEIIYYDEIVKDEKSGKTSAVNITGRALCPLEEIDEIYSIKNRGMQPPMRGGRGGYGPPQGGKGGYYDGGYDREPPQRSGGYDYGNHYDHSDHRGPPQHLSGGHKGDKYGPPRGGRGGKGFRNNDRNRDRY